MKLNFKKILFVPILVCYLLSALEINACGIENTFFDEFDTYVESKELGLFSTVEIQENKSLTDYHTQLNFKKLFATMGLDIQKKVCLHNPNPPNNHKGNSLYIFHSVWII